MVGRVREDITSVVSANYELGAPLGSRVVKGGLVMCHCGRKVLILVARVSTLVHSTYDNRVQINTIYPGKREISKMNTKDPGHDPNFIISPHEGVLVSHRKLVSDNSALAIGAHR